MIYAANPPLNLLVVDDDELDRLAVRRCLQQSGIDARSDQAASAVEALERASSTDYDCILLDYYLPGEDSLVTLRQLHESAPRTPVVIFTGRGDEDIAVELMKSGAADYLPKATLTPERLGAAIRHALRVWDDAAARRRAERLLRLLSEAARDFLKATDPDELVRGLWDNIREPLGIDAYWNVMMDGAGERPRLASFGGLSEDEVSSLLDPQTGAAVFTADEPMHLTDIQASEDGHLQTLKAAGIRACSSHPLSAGEKTLGTLGFGSRDKDAFAEDELEFLGTVSHYATLACQRLRHIEEMRLAERRKDEFLATLAHELRDPLAPLGNVVELMKRSTSSRVLKQVRATMERQVGQLVQLVDDLLDISRITRSALPLRKQRVDLGSAVHQAVEMAGPLVEAAGQELQVSLPEQPIYLYADPVRLAQVFGNLLTNASKFTDPKGRITLSAERQDGEVIITVMDTGIGIPPDELTSIFGMFTQVSSQREQSHGGLGIGLTLVSRLVEMHEGSVEARSEGLGKGSQFVVRLPVIAENSKALPVEQADELARDGERRILIVDDNRDSATSLAMLLQISGNTTHEAYNGLNALDAAREFRPDAVLLDIGLPDLDGYQVCRRLREQSRGRDLLIVALSGWGQADDRRKSKEAGFDHHMVKPVKLQDLKKLLGRSGITARQEAAG